MHRLLASIRSLSQALCLLTVFGFTVQAQVVISQVYGGGGNSGATLRNDFVELFNRGTVPVDVTGWTVQYASANGSSWQTTPLSGILQPGQYYLVQQAQGAGGSQNLPTADATGNIAMSATAGKTALVTDGGPLTGTCPASPAIADFVGFGNTNCSEASSTPALSNTTAALRQGSGCLDSGNNAGDFSVGQPSPRNSLSALNLCDTQGTIVILPATLPAATLGANYAQMLSASGGTAPYLFSISAGTLPLGLNLSPDGMITGIPTSAAGSPYAFTVTVADSTGITANQNYQLTAETPQSCNVTNTIAEVQGSGARSPLAGRTVTVQGIVTLARNNGFFVQMSPGDGDASTSDSVLVFTGSTPPSVAQPGNSVCVTASVLEYIPSNAPNSAPVTELNLPSRTSLLSSGNALPEPVTLTASDLNPGGSFDALERYEGMRVRVNSLTAVSPTLGSVNESSATSNSLGVFFGVLPSVNRPFREAGIQIPDPLPAGAPCCIPRYDGNPETLGIDSSRLAATLEVSSGATITNIVGPLDYARRVYTVVLEPNSGAQSSGGAQAMPIPLADNSILSIATYNLERFFDSVDAPGVSDAVLTAAALERRLNKASLAIRNILRAPDILGVEEMENLTTLQALAQRINSDAVASSQENPNYQAFLVSGNDIGGINVGFLVKTLKVQVSSVTQIGKDTTYENPDGSTAILNDRPPLVLDAIVLRPGSEQGLPVTVIVNHLRSLISLDDPADGPRVRAKRQAQAEYLARYIQSRQEADPTLHLASVGDYNAYQFSDGYVDVLGVVKGTPAPADQVVLAGPALLNPNLTDLVETDLLPNNQRYSYTFSGSAQVLDHIVVNTNLLNRATGFAYGRLGADFPESLRGDATRPERLSDHDAAVAYFRLPFAVTSKTNISSTGFAYSRVSGTFNGSVTVRNTTNTALDGPVYLELRDLPAGIVLQNRAGEQNGNPYVEVGSTGLAPNQTLTVPLRFANPSQTNPSQTAINFTPVVYAGGF